VTLCLSLTRHPSRPLLKPTDLKTLSEREAFSKTTRFHSSFKRRNRLVLETVTTFGKNWPADEEQTRSTAPRSTELASTVNCKAPNIVMIHFFFISYPAPFFWPCLSVVVLLLFLLPGFLLLTVVLVPVTLSKNVVN